MKTVAVVRIVNEVVAEIEIENLVQDHVTIGKEIIAIVDVIDLKVDREVEKEAVKKVINVEIRRLIENQLTIHRQM